jgi:hypothetical protein
LLRSACRRVGKLQSHVLVEAAGTPHHRGQESRRRKHVAFLSKFLSTAGHGKPGRNPRGPPRKAKYSLATDSELVP